MRGILLIPIFLIVPAMTFAQTEQSPSEIARVFLQSVFKGDLVRAEQFSNSLIIADGKTYGEKSERLLEQGLQSLQASGYEYHKEMSVEISEQRARVFVELVRRGGEIINIEIFEILLVPSGKGWKIFGWRRITPPVELDRPIRPMRPTNLPVVRPCPSCV